MQPDTSDVKSHEAHGHFYKYIESFPGQKKVEIGHGHLPPKEITLDHLRNELVDLTLNPKKIQSNLCYRNCFKMQEREYIEFCLNKKCSQNDFFEAARALNYLK